MQESKVSEEVRPESSEPSSNDEIRVTDRRRFNLDGESASPNSEGDSADAPNLKPRFVEELESRTLEAERKVAEVQSRFEQLRTELQRETDETRQRLNRAADDRATREKIEFVSTLLPVVENLQRAIDAADQGSSFESLLEGVRGTLSNFENALAVVGVEPIKAVGEAFDPEIHDAVDTVEVDDDSDGTVTEEYGRGYKLGERLLRPARVQVGRAGNEAKQAAE
jgi:molecular chaperone GrpE